MQQAEGSYQAEFFRNYKKRIIQLYRDRKEINQQKGRMNQRFISKYYKIKLDILGKENKNEVF